MNILWYEIMLAGDYSVALGRPREQARHQFFWSQAGGVGQHHLLVHEHPLVRDLRRRLWLIDDVVLREEATLARGHDQRGCRGGGLARDPGDRHGDEYHGFGPLLPTCVPVVLVLRPLVGS